MKFSSSSNVTGAGNTIKTQRTTCMDMYRKRSQRLYTRLGEHWLTSGKIRTGGFGGDDAEGLTFTFSSTGDVEYFSRMYSHAVPLKIHSKLEGRSYRQKTYYRQRTSGKDKATEDPIHHRQTLGTAVLRQDRKSISSHSIFCPGEK